MPINEETRQKILATLFSEETRKEIYEWAMERSREIQSGECRILLNKPEPVWCPCPTCRFD